MKKTDDRTSENFCLSNSYFECDHDPLTEIADGEICFGKPEKANQPGYSKSKSAQCEQNGERKYNLLYHVSIFYEDQLLYEAL